MISVDPKGAPGRLDSTDTDRWTALKNQRHTVGLNASERDEFKALCQKLNRVK